MTIATYSPEDLRILSRYVTDADGDVYCIYNLPEEVIAVIFAYVSRSPLSFRENLLALLKGGELDVQTLIDTYSNSELDYKEAEAKAKAFHERWVVGYGHSSVAEHATAHVGVERISRLASAALELSNPFLSFTEYSQRYQKPTPGSFYRPLELEAEPELKRIYQETCDQTYQSYEELYRGLVAWLDGRLPRGGKESDRGYRTRVEKSAFEDARYALPLATLTNLGMTGNGRALRDAIVSLYAEPFPEVAELAGSLTREISKVLPSLLRHAELSEYLCRVNSVMKERLLQLVDLTEPAAAPTAPGEARDAAGDPATIRQGDVTLADWTGRTEDAALTEIVAGALYAGGGWSYIAAREAASRLGYGEKLSVFEAAIDRLSPHDNPVDHFHAVSYTAELCISEANWHQLLRHCRKVQYTPQPPSVENGVTIPPHIRDAGLADVLEQAVEASAKAVQLFAAKLPFLAPYLVSNAHKRRVVARIDLWELYHLVNLRTSKEAQWDIRQTVLDLQGAVEQVHPNLLKRAKRRD